MIAKIYDKPLGAKRGHKPWPANPVYDQNHPNLVHEQNICTRFAGDHLHLLQESHTEGYIFAILSQKKKNTCNE